MCKIAVFLFIISLCQYSLASREILSLLDSATDLTSEETNALQPLFHELQKQYDYIISESNQNRDSMDAKYMLLYDSTQKEFEQQYEVLLEELKTPSRHFDAIEFFHVNDLIDFANANSTQNQQLEAQDIQSSIQVLLDELQLSVDVLARLNRDMEANLIEINKPEIVAKIYNALKQVFFAAVRVSRAAYCTYSYTPQLNESLQHIHNGIDCFKFTLGLVQAIKAEITHTLQTIRHSVEELANIFRDIQKKPSIVGKIFAIVASVPDIKNDVAAIAKTVQQLGEKWQNEMPNAANTSKECTVDFIRMLPQVVDTVTNVTTCILFVDDSTVDYDFMKPEDQDDRDYD